MLVLGIDVLLMAAFAMLLVTGCYVVCVITAMPMDEAVASLRATIMTSLLMVVMYMVMANVLDMLAMA